MAKTIMMYMCMICSAMDEDTKKFREICRNTMNHWNEMNSMYRGICFIPNGQENVIPSMEKTPQASIDKQILEKADIGIVIFKNRTGTPYIDPDTEKKYESGTEYELQKLIENKIVPHVYIKNINRLKSIKERIGDYLFFGSYKGRHDFEEQIKDLLDRLANEYSEKRRICIEDTENVIRKTFFAKDKREKIFDYLKNHETITRREIDETFEMDKEKTLEVLNALVFAGLVQKQGSGRGIVYRIKETDKFL